MRTAIENRRIIKQVIGAFGVLAAVGTTSVCADPPQTILLPGIVRDFHKSDSDFVVMPNGGTGHYAGNIAEVIDASMQPTFTGDGFRVSAQWRDKFNNNLAPNMYRYNFGGAGVIPVVEASSPPSGGQSMFDTYDSAAGPYGGANVGPAPVFQVGAAMPEINIPHAVSSLPSAGNVTYSGTNSLNSDLHCNALNISGTLTIHGDRNIMCDGTLLMETQAVIALAPGASLNLYMMQGGASWNHVVVGDTLNPHRVRVFNLSANELMIHNHAQVYAAIIMPYAKLNINNHGELFGLFAGNGTIFGNHAKLHIDGGSLPYYCGDAIQDTVGTAGAASTGGIGSAATFSNWYKDTLGANLSNVHTIQLTRNVSGIYEFLESEFHPIDDQLFGNEGDDHNYYFTYAIEITFNHKSCAETFFEFEGDDDAWLFIDGKLAMDLGGVMPGVKQYVPIDRIANLQDGQTYTLQFFYAQRQSNRAIFRMRTNLDLNAPAAPYVISGLGD